MVKVCVLVSGGGTNLKALIDAAARGELPSAALALVVSNKPDAYALTRAKDAGIPTLVINNRDYADRESFDAALLEAMRQYEIEFVVCAGFLRIFSSVFTDAYPNRIINIHPSLLPSFGGKGFYGLHVHRAALDYGVKVTGATVFLVNEITDGGKILLQKAVDVCDNDTPEILQQRVMEQAEQVILPQATELCCKKLLDGRG